MSNGWVLSMKYNIEYSAQARRGLERLDTAIQIQILRKISHLSENPELGAPLGNVLKTKRSIHVGKYRAVYSIVGTSIIIARIGHRKNVYE